MEYWKDIFIGSILGIGSFLFSYFKIFLKLKFEVENTKSVISEMKKNLNDRFTSVENKQANDIREIRDRLEKIYEILTNK